MQKSFDLNVEAMSRAALIANYFDAVHLCEELTNGGDGKIEKIRQAFKISEGRAVIVSMLLTGRLCSKSQLHMALGSYETTDEKIITIYVSYLRDVFHGTGITIETIWGAGYKMSAPAIQKAKDILDGAAQYEPAVRIIPKVNYWTKADIAYLLKNYLQESRSVTAKKLGRSEGAITVKYNKIMRDQRERSQRTQRAA